MNEERARQGERELNAAIERLERCGWSARGELRMGVPLERLLNATDDFRGDVLILGARHYGVERALLGSKHDPVAVLLIDISKSAFWPRAPSTSRSIPGSSTNSSSGGTTSTVLGAHPQRRHRGESAAMRSAKRCVREIRRAIKA